MATEPQERYECNDRRLSDVDAKPASNGQKTTALPWEDEGIRNISIQIEMFKQLRRYCTRRA